jgi:hypothetical protein
MARGQLSALSSQLSALGEPLSEESTRNFRVKSGGGECPPYTSEVKIPTSRKGREKWGTQIEPTL